MKINILSPVLVIAASILLLILGLAGPLPSKDIIDVSWPNCDNLPSGYTRGIVGVTGGLNFHVNACLGEEAPLFSSYSLYMNSGYPGLGVHKSRQLTPLSCLNTDIACHAYNYGYNAAAFAIKQADLRNAHSLTWWIDVETDNSWSSAPYINRASLTGMVDAIRSYIFMPKIGFYSYPAQWGLITGKWNNGLPAWTATGQLKLSDAKRACSQKSFNGGETVMAQYTDKYDINVPCSINSLKLMPI